MRNLTIEVWDASGNKKQLVELPADAPVNRVIAVLVDNEIYPAIKVQSFDGNVVHDLGLGIYRWADVIVGGLDNREARVAINLAAARAGKVWIDGAIERLEGVARVFDPATGPCYECTMG
jgi:molybdopterin/thiamine biosynthesis adenylyltransferase